MTTTLSIFNLLDPEVVANPYSFYDELRRFGPIYWDTYLKGWVCTGYEEVQTALRSSQVSNHRVVTIAELEALGLSDLAPLYYPLLNQLIFIDPPKHTRIRSLTSKVFTPRKVEMLKDYLQGLVDLMLSDVYAQGKVDLMAQIAYPLPLRVISELLGVPVEDHIQLKKWSDDYASMLGSFQYIPDDPEEVLKSLNDMTEYFRTIIQEYREHPKENLLSELIIAQEQEQGNRLDNDELLANCIFLLAAAHETTTNLIGNGMLTLLRHPDQLELLQQDRSLMGNAIEEMLRYESPAQYISRKAGEDFTLGGRQIKKGQPLLLVLGAANRDPVRFPDPTCFDIRREDNRHLAFGFGAHFCFGAPLARAEAKLAMTAILDRLPNLQLDTTDVVWRANMNLRGLATLPVVFDRPVLAHRPRHDLLDGYYSR
jgi:pimeloyl-[acyl-carrier protein] synthase